MITISVLFVEEVKTQNTNDHINPKRRGGQTESGKRMFINLYKITTDKDD